MPLEEFLAAAAKATPSRLKDTAAGLADADASPHTEAAATTSREEMAIAFAALDADDDQLLSLVSADAVAVVALGTDAGP